MIKTLLKEPLLHFLAAGILIFAGYGLFNRGADENPRILRVTEAEVNWLSETWARQWMRRPTEEELRGLVTDYVKERLLASEAMELGLDENDTIVRRRLAQKMEFIVKDTARFAEPAEAELVKYYEAHPEYSRSESRISFKQIFFSRDRREDAETDAKNALEKIVQSDSVSENLGDPSLLEAEYRDIEESALIVLFGDDFAKDVLEVKPGRWGGPIQSAYGLHLVFVWDINPGTQLPYEEVKEKIRNRRIEDLVREANEKYFADLFRKYDVVVDKKVKWVPPVLTRDTQKNAA